MQNQAFWARLGLLWCLFIFAACWCAGVEAAPLNSSGPPADHSAAVLVPPSGTITTTIAVANSQAAATRAVAASSAVAYAIPTLDGFGLFVLAALLGVGVLWVWRRRQ